MSKKIEIGFEDFYNYYIVENHSVEECAGHFGCSVSPIHRIIKDNGLYKTKYKMELGMRENKRKIKLDREELQEKISLGWSQGRCAKYFGCSEPIIRRNIRELGVVQPQKPANCSKTREKDPLSQQKRKEELKNKRERTCLQKYGVKNVFELKEVQDRIKQTNLVKYGSISPMKNLAVRKKASRSLKKTLSEKYNHSEMAEHIKEFSLDLGRKITPTELIEATGKSQSNAYLLMHRYHLEEYVQLSENEFENSIKDFLQQNGLDVEMHNRQIIRPQEVDLYIPEYKVGIEANDINTHNSTYCSYKGGKPKPKNYHYYKSLGCEEQGARLIHVWDYEWYDPQKRPILESIILGACNRAKTIYARKCKIEVRESREMKPFFEKNNIAGHRGGKFAICLVYEGEVVMAYMMGHAYFGKGKYEWEVIRGATKLGYRVIGGASKIWKYFVKNYNPKNCVYYVDYNYFNGNSVSKLGFRYTGVKPTVKNYFVRGGKVTSRQPSRHQEIKKMIEAKKVWELWTAGVKVYTWENPDLL